MIPQRALRWSVFLLLLAIHTGCIGQRNAIKSQTKLQTATDTAIGVANSLKSAMAADLQAHQITRATLRELAADQRKKSLAVATLPLIQVRNDSLLEGEMGFSRVLREFQAGRHAATVSIPEALRKQAMPLEKEAEAAEKATLAAKENLGDRTNELSLVLALAEADATYASFVAQYNDSIFNGYTNFVLSWDAREASLTARAAKAVELQRQTVQAAFDQAVATLKAMALPEFDIGPEPADNTAVVDGLIKYAETVQLASEAMEDYLESNSFGKGSFFQSALRSFAKGAFGALPIVGSGQGATLQEVKGSGTDLWQAVQDQFKQTAQSATKTAQETMKSALDEALDNGKNAVGNALLPKKSGPSPR